MRPFRTLAFLLSCATAAHASAPWRATGPEGGLPYSADVAGSLLRIGTQDGVYQSSDAGANWSRLGDLPRGTFAYQVLSDPGNADHVIAVAAQGLFVSTDGGAHWTDAGVQLNAALFDAANPTIVFGTDQSGSALHRSSDGGASWSTVPLPGGGAIRALGVSPDPLQAHAFFVSTYDGVLYRSTDDGANWTPYYSGLMDYVYGIASDAGDGDTLLFAESNLDVGRVLKFSKSGGTQTIVLTVDQGHRLLRDPITSGSFWFGAEAFGNARHLFHSADHGGNWTDVGQQPGQLLALDPVTSGRLYGTDAEGFARSDDGGVSWTSYTHGVPLAPTTAVSISADGSEILAGLAAGGTALSLDGGNSWQRNATTPLPNGVHGLQRLPGADATIYATANNGFFKSTDGGRHWSAVALVSGPFPTGAVGVDATNPNALVSAAGWSDDGGANWYALKFSGVVSLPEIAFAPNGAHRVYALSWIDYQHRNVFRAPSHGATFVPVADSTQIASLAVDPRDDAHLIAFAKPASGNYWQVYRSTDGGDHWQVQGTLVYDGDDSTPRAVFDPCTPATLSALTGKAVFRSTDGGMTWSQHGLTIPSYAPSQLAAVCHAGYTIAAAATQAGVELQSQVADLVFSDGFGG